MPNGVPKVVRNCGRGQNSSQMHEKWYDQAFQCNACNVRKCNAMSLRSGHDLSILIYMFDTLSLAFNLEESLVSEHNSDCAVE